MSIPLMFIRQQPCKNDTTIKPNARYDKTHRVSYIVVLPTYTDFTNLSTAWQDNPKFPEGEILIPSIDLLDDANTFVFDSDNVEDNRRNALAKMKELWSQVSVNS